MNANYRCMNVAAEVFKGKIVGTTNRKIEFVPF